MSSFFLFSAFWVWGVFFLCLFRMASSFAVGETVLALYIEDGEWYEAQILEADDDGQVFLVVFVEYGN